MMDALDAGADDMSRPRTTCFAIYTDPDDFQRRGATPWTAKGYTFASAESARWCPRTTMKLTDEEQTSRTWRSCSTCMEDDDDVQNVWHNWDED